MVRFFIVGFILFISGFIVAELLVLYVYKHPLSFISKVQTSVIDKIYHTVDTNPYYQRQTKDPLVHDEAMKHLIEAEIPWIESLRSGSSQKLTISYEAEGTLTEAYRNVASKSFVMTIENDQKEKIMHYNLKDSEKNRSRFLFYKKGSKQPTQWEKMIVGSRVRFTEQWNLHHFPIVFSHSIIEL